jgi:hypothetical protein
LPTVGGIAVAEDDNRMLAVHVDLTDVPLVAGGLCREQ